MSIARKYSLAAVQLDTGSDVLISGITTQGLSTNTQVDQEPTSGEVYNRWLSITGMDPNGRFATYHLATALASIGLGGLSIGSLATGLALWLQKHLEGGSRTAGANHRKYLMTEGIVIPRTLSVAHGPNQHATVTYEIIPTWDGINDPIQIFESQNLPTAEADDERFALGPMTIGNKSLAQFRSFEIDFAINAVAEGGDSDIFPTYISIESIMPVLRFRGIDPEWMKSTNIPLAGLACTHANTILYLRKRADAGTFELDGVAEHIKLTADGLAHIEEAVDATGSGATETSLVLPLRWDGTGNAPLTINTASAIT